MEPGIPQISLLQKHYEKEAKRDVFPKGEHYGQLVAIPFMIVFLLFFYGHYVSDSGFFKSNFGMLEAVLFYIPLFTGMVPLSVKFYYNRRNKSRPFDIINDIIILITGIYLLAVWPFDFTHFAAPLPSGLQFIISWISDGLLQTLLPIGFTFLGFFTVLETFTYFGVKRVLSMTPPPTIEKPAEPIEIKHNP